MKFWLFHSLLLVLVVLVNVSQQFIKGRRYKPRFVKFLDESDSVGRVTNLRIRSDGPNAIFLTWSAPYQNTNELHAIDSYRIGWGKRYLDEYITQVEGWRHGCRVTGLESITKYILSIRAMGQYYYGPALYQTVTTEISPCVLFLANNKYKKIQNKF